VVHVGVSEESTAEPRCALCNLKRGSLCRGVEIIKVGSNDARYDSKFGQEHAQGGKALSGVCRSSAPPNEGRHVRRDLVITHRHMVGPHAAAQMPSLVMRTPIRRNSSQRRSKWSRSVVWSVSKLAQPVATLSSSAHPYLKRSPNICQNRTTYRIYSTPSPSSENPPVA
jgi:hypothetical protein